MYSKYSPGSSILFDALPWLEPLIVNQINVLGKSFGSVTDPAQLGARASVRTISVRSSFPLLVTRILNTALSP